MNYLKNISISIGFIIFSLIILILFTTILNYFNIIGSSLCNTLKLLTPIISLFIGGFYIGRNSNQKGWLEGLKLSIIFLIILILFQYLAFDNKFEVKNILYYIIISISCVFGSIIGINKKRERNN